MIEEQSENPVNSAPKRKLNVSIRTLPYFNELKKNYKKSYFENIEEMVKDLWFTFQEI